MDQHISDSCMPCLKDTLDLWSTQAYMPHMDLQNILEGIGKLLLYFFQNTLHLTHMAMDCKG